MNKSQLNKAIDKELKRLDKNKEVTISCSGEVRKGMSTLGAKIVLSQMLKQLEKNINKSTKKYIRIK